MQEIGAEIPLTKPTSVEIKPPRPGLLRDSLNKDNNERTKTKENGGRQLDYLLVFGQGHVLDETTKLQPVVGSADVKETAIAWMKNIARAAGELYLEGATKKIVLTGGKTGGNYKGLTKKGQVDERMSEAELMKEILVKEYQVPETDIILEDNATNTLQNIPLSLNKIDSEQTGPEKPKIGLLGADFHLSRIRLLAKFFGIENSQAFSAEQIFNFIAEKTNDASMKQQVRLMLNPNEDLSAPNSRVNWSDTSGNPKSALKSATLFEEQKGEEKKGLVDRLLDENWFTFGLLEKPKYWIGYLSFLQNNDRLLSILNFIDKSSPNLLRELGIDIRDEPENIKNLLKKYTDAERELPPSFSQGRSVTWDDSSKEKLETLVKNE